MKGLSVGAPQTLVATAHALCGTVSTLTFGPPVTHVYNPLEYAREPHRRYLVKYGGLGAPVLLVGMNPGPFGMAQSGVPFGDVAVVRDWLRITGRVERPRAEHPKRPVLGFGCRRGEVSGQRLWGWARAVFGTPERFFAAFFVWNYCPLVFIEEGGRNRTPDKLSATERAALYPACDEALRRVVAAMVPTHVVGIGRFADGRARTALREHDVKFGWVPHPSPASPAANRDWAAQFETALRRLGIVWQ